MIYRPPPIGAREVDELPGVYATELLVAAAVSLISVGESPTNLKAIC